MKTVWLVMWYPPPQPTSRAIHVSAVCATEAIAEEWIKDSVFPDNYSIEQWEIKTHDGLGK